MYVCTYVCMNERTNEWMNISNIYTAHALMHERCHSVSVYCNIWPNSQLRHWEAVLTIRWLLQGSGAAAVPREKLETPIPRPQWGMSWDSSNISNHTLVFFSIPFPWTLSQGAKSWSPATMRIERCPGVFPTGLWCHACQKGSADLSGHPTYLFRLNCIYRIYSISIIRYNQHITAYKYIPAMPECD